MGGQVVIRGYAVHWAAFCSCAEAPQHEHSGNSLEIKAAFILHAEKKKDPSRLNYWKKFLCDWCLNVDNNERKKKRFKSMRLCKNKQQKSRSRLVEILKEISRPDDTDPPTWRGLGPSWLMPSLSSHLTSASVVKLEGLETRNPHFHFKKSTTSLSYSTFKTGKCNTKKQGIQTNFSSEGFNVSVESSGDTSTGNNEIRLILPLVIAHITLYLGTVWLSNLGTRHVCVLVGICATFFHSLSILIHVRQIPTYTRWRWYETAVIVPRGMCGMRVPAGSGNNTVCEDRVHSTCALGVFLICVSLVGMTVLGLLFLSAECGGFKKDKKILCIRSIF